MCILCLQQRTIFNYSLHNMIDGDHYNEIVCKCNKKNAVRDKGIILSLTFYWLILLLKQLKGV